MKYKLLFICKIFSVLILMFAFSSCMISMNNHAVVHAKRVYGDGNITERTLDPGECSGFNVGPGFTTDIDLYQDTINSVTLVGDSNIIAEYYTRVDNGIINIVANDYTILAPTHQMRLVFHLKKINTINIENCLLNGKNLITTNTLHLNERSINTTLNVNCDSLFCDLSLHACEKPHLFLEGKSGYSHFKLQNYCSLEALKFSGNRIEFQNDPLAVFTINPKNFKEVSYWPSDPDMVKDKIEELIQR